jgi:hypothetical protein
MGIEKHKTTGNPLLVLLAFGSAIGLHLFVAGLIVAEVFGPFSRNPGMPVLELASLELEMIARPHAEQEMVAQVSPDEDLLPMRILNGATKLGHSEKTTGDILRAIRKTILTLWEPARASGRGRAVVVLDFDSNARVTGTQIAAVTGTKDFVGFMKEFADQLQGLQVVERQCGLIRVECEFRVGE